MHFPKAKKRRKMGVFDTGFLYMTMYNKSSLCMFLYYTLSLSYMILFQQDR